MKITNVYTEKYRWPKEKPIANGKHVYTHNELNLLCIDTDEGITGYGCSWEINFCERIGKSLIGEDPLNHERLWQKMYIPKFLGRKGNSLWTISAIDIALWDIKSKVSGMPLYQLLGGAKDRIPYYIAGGYYGPDKGIRELQQEMEEYMSWGAKAVKMKVGALSIKEDIERVRAVRDVIGYDTKLMVDANCAYRFYQASEFARKAEEFDLFWLEEPVEQDDYEGYKKIAAKSNIPLAAGENENTRFGYRDLIASQAISILNPDAETLGGITEFMKIAAMADAHGLDISPHGQQQVHVHLNCAVPNSIIAEFYPPQYDQKVYEAFVNPITLNDDGTISPPQAPGTGLDINRDVLAPYLV